MFRPSVRQSLTSGIRLFAVLALGVLSVAAAQSQVLAAGNVSVAAIKKGVDDSTGCLSPNPKAGLQAFIDCTAQHAKAPQGTGSEQDSYLLGLDAQSWAMVNLQSLKAWDASAHGNEVEKAEAMKAANVLQSAAHDYFLDMRKLQKKLNVTDPALCESLGVPYEVLQSHFQFYENWQ